MTTNEIRTLFSKYQREFKEDEKVYEKGALESLELIEGFGEITEKRYGDCMYVEYLNKGSLILVVHAGYSKPIFTYGYGYEISLFRNTYTLEQIGGGYGTGGIVTKNYPRIFSYTTYQDIYRSKQIISNVINDIKTYIAENQIG